MILRRSEGAPRWILHAGQGDTSSEVSFWRCWVGWFGGRCHELGEMARSLMCVVAMGSSGAFGEMLRELGLVASEMNSQSSKGRKELVYINALNKAR